MINKFIHCIAISFILLSCNSKEIKSPKGAIDIISNIYFNASKGLDKMQTFHISKLNYSNDTIIEIVPNPYAPEIDNSIYFIKDSIYYHLNNTEFIQALSHLDKIPIQNVYKKTNGAIFSKERIPNEHAKRQIRDTVLFNKKYKRFEINSPQSFSRFYVHPTDTLLPYRIYEDAAKFFGGRIERIDSYDKEKDIFVTMQLIPRQKWDKEAEEIFDFLKFINHKNRKK